MILWSSLLTKSRVKLALKPNQGFVPFFCAECRIAGIYGESVEMSGVGKMVEWYMPSVKMVVFSVEGERVSNQEEHVGSSGTVVPVFMSM